MNYIHNHTSVYIKVLSSTTNESLLLYIKTRRSRGDQIEVLKILNGYENMDRNIFFSLKKDSRTRGHEVT